MNGHFINIWYGNLLNEDFLEKQHVPDYWTLLSENEREKSESYSRPDLQKKYIKMRAVLRIILAPYLNIEPQDIIIKTGEHGKPFLTEANIYFNLSHTANKFVVAVSNIGEVGIDIEKFSDRRSLLALINKCFSENERKHWNSLAEEQKLAMFYRFWVRKEAFVKAVGRGLALGLENCSVNPLEQTRFLSIPDEYGLPSNWRITDIPIDQEHTCAVVTKDTEFEYQQTEVK